MDGRWQEKEAGVMDGRKVFMLRNCKKGAGIAHTEILGKEWVWGRKLGFGFGHAVSYAC